MPVIGSIGGSQGPAGPQGPAGATGATGAAGTPGTIWYNSTMLSLGPGVAPADNIGNNGDHYIDVNPGATNGQIRQKTGGTWA